MIDNHTWLDKVKEEPLEPAREIIDPHHHLWNDKGTLYDLKEFWVDTSAGHNIVKTIFIECHTNYRSGGKEHLLPVGETEYVVERAKQSAGGGADGGKAEISGIVAYADLTSPHLDEILDEHQRVALDLFKGIRHAGAYDGEKQTLSILNDAPTNLFQQEAFRQGVRRLGERGLSYDSWHYHPQNEDFLNLVQSCPDTTFVLDHFGTPLGVGRFKGKREEVFADWQKNMAQLAACPNLYAKLGGLAMPDNGFYFHKQALPPSSNLIVETQGKYYRHMIDCFGASRCMFESNFPVDRLSLSYTIYWNAMKKLSTAYSPAEQDDLFYNTAANVYKL